MPPSARQRGRSCTSARCPLCSSRSSPALRAVDRNRQVDEREFDYQSCPSCATLFLSPVPDDLRRSYSPAYRQLPDPERFEAEVREAASRLALLPDGGGRRLVDVGAGNGAFCVAARRAGYDALGLEIDADLVAFMLDQGVQARAADSVAAGLGDVGQADVITAWHVIEHVPDPGSLLAEISRALAPGGVAVVATPNPQSLQRRLMRGRWPHLDAPRHLVLLPAATLVAHGTGIGLRCRGVLSTDAAGLAWNAFGWEQALRSPGATGIQARGRYWLAELAKAAARPVERRGRHGATYTVVFEKPVGAG